MISCVSRLRTATLPPTLQKDVTPETRHPWWKVEPFLPYIRGEIHEAVGERGVASSLLILPFYLSPFLFLPMHDRAIKRENVKEVEETGERSNERARSPHGVCDDEEEVPFLAMVV